MRSTKQFSVTLPNEMAREITARVASDEYASDSEAIGEDLRATRAREKAVDHGLRGEVGDIYDGMKVDPSRARSISDVKVSLGRAHKRTSGRT